MSRSRRPAPGRTAWSSAKCGAANRVRGRIASPENVTESSTRCLTTPAPVASALVGSGSNFPLPLSHACLLWWNLWSCGRRVCVVQAQRQIHRVLLARCAAARKASVDQRGPEYHSVCDFASPLLHTTLKCAHGLQFAQPPHCG